MSAQRLRFKINTCGFPWPVARRVDRGREVSDPESRFQTLAGRRVQGLVQTVDNLVPYGDFFDVAIAPYVDRVMISLLCYGTTFDISIST